jgi:putative FmdB family regulatory protein
MPVYEYICLDCHKTFEVVRPISQGTKKATCPRCDSKKVERHWSSVFVETSKKS